jgi:hypothetical protein
MAEEDIEDDAIERWMRERAALTAPPGFTSGVLARVRQERWQTERYWDVGFNTAIAAGLLLIGAGILGLIYISGLAVVGRDAVLLFVNAITTVADQVAPALPAYTAAFALTATALGLWWYVENY